MDRALLRERLDVEKTDLEKLVKEELADSNAKLYVSQITRFHRIQGSQMLHEAAEYVKSELVRVGLDKTLP